MEQKICAGRKDRQIFNNNNNKGGEFPALATNTKPIYHLTRLYCTPAPMYGEAFLPFHP